MKRLHVLAFTLALTLAAAGLTLLPAAPIDAQVGAALGCESGPTGGWCEAGPTGEGFSYAWSSNGAVSLHAGAGNFRRYCCYKSGGGSVSVAVTHPDGQRFIATKFVSCAVW